MGDTGSNPHGRILACVPLLAALLPAVVLLAGMEPLRVPVPYRDQWSFVAQYEQWMAGGYGWSNLFAKEGDHPGAVGRVIYFAVLHVFKGNVALLPLLNWGLSALIVGCLWPLVRRAWKDDLAARTGVMFLISLTVFNAAQGGVWIWDCTFQSYLPGACLAAGMAILFTGQLSWLRALAVLVLSFIATFSYAAGFLVGLLLSAPLWLQLRDRKLAITGAWVALQVVFALLALAAFGQAKYFQDTPLSFGMLLENPLMRMQFVILLLAQMLGKGTILEPFTLSTICGIALLAVFGVSLVVLVRRRANMELVRNAMPWLLCALYGLLHSVLVSIGRMHNSLTNPDALAERVMAERFITFSLFFVLGVVIMALVVLHHGGLAEATRSWLRRLCGPAMTVLVALEVVNWEAGNQLMKMENKMMKQERALLSLGEFVKPDPDRLWNRELKFNTIIYARKLAELGRLPGVRFIPDPKITSFITPMRGRAKGGKLNTPTMLADGSWQLSGICPFQKVHSMDLPDLIVITAQRTDEPNSDERLLTAAAPVMPETFYERESQRLAYTQHFFGWKQTLDDSQMPPGKVRLRAYSYDHDARRLQLIDEAETSEPHSGPLAMKGTGQST
jgi:hypothetical protein